MRFQVLALVVGAALTAHASKVEGSFQRDLKVSGPCELRVASPAGTIKISRGSAGEVHISARIEGNTNSYWNSRPSADVVRELEQNPPVRQDGNRITIGQDVREIKQVGISYEITVPPDTQVIASSGAGTVDVRDVKEAELSTGAGNLIADRIAGSVNARTGAGSIHVTHAGGQVKAHSGTGNIDVNDVKGDVIANSGIGNITATRVTGHVNAHTSMGHVNTTRGITEM